MNQLREIEDNFVTLKNVFISMSEAIKHLEQKETMLEKDNKALSDANKSLQESSERLVKLNDKQQEILGNVSDNAKLLEIELEDMKKENLKLKASMDNSLKNSHQPFINKHSQGILEAHNLSLQKKIVDLEKQLSQSQTSKRALNFEYDDEQVSKLKNTNNTLLLQNRLLKEQLTNFRNLHYQTVSEYRLNYVNAKDDSQQTNNINISCMDIDSLNQDELQPLKVNVIDSDVEYNSKTDY